MFKISISKFDLIIMDFHEWLSLSCYDAESLALELGRMMGLHFIYIIYYYFVATIQCVIYNRWILRYLCNIFSVASYTNDQQ